jgi:uncharacterized membrane protein
MVWIGGSAFIALVVVPALRKQDLGGRSPEALRAIAYRFRAVGWTSLVLLALTGLSNLALRGIPLIGLLDGSAFGGPYGRVLAIKLSLVAAILALGGVHDFFLGPRAAAVILEAPDSPAAQRARRTASWMGRINLLLGLAVVFAAGVLTRGW